MGEGQRASEELLQPGQPSRRCQRFYGGGRLRDCGLSMSKVGCGKGLLLLPRRFVRFRAELSEGIAVVRVNGEKISEACVEGDISEALG